MGSNDLRKRKIWQARSGFLATNAEHTFFNAFKIVFKETNFTICSNPNEFKKIYVNYPLQKKVLKEIYIPDSSIITHGITPDYAIDHKKTGKTLYIEVKRQDGWVEGKPRSAGRGNAHERLCKYFTPGLLKILREKSEIDSKSLPFWIVFIGDITRDPCRVREITCWFDNYNEHFYFWRDVSNPIPLINHFDFYLKSLLC
ncbi:MAG: MunI family type II restriction endonuclease [Alphaproteobacteria bacterium]